VTPDDLPRHDDEPARPAEPDARSRILRATSELITELGWNRVTTRRVAERAAVNNALLHYYFGTKRALLQQAAAQALMEELSSPLASLISGGDLGRGVREAIAWFDEARASNASGRLIIEVTLQALRDPELQTMVRGMLSEFRDAVEARALAEGRVREEARGLAVMLTALLDGLYLHALLDPDLDLRAAAVALRPLWPEEDR